MAATPIVSKTRWMIYGANGYTGRLASRLPRPEGMEAPILAGRNITSISTYPLRHILAVHLLIEAWNSDISRGPFPLQSPSPSP